MSPSEPGAHGVPDNRRLILAVLVGASSLGLAATSIYLPSIPQMARDLGVRVGSVQNTVTAYLVAFGIGTLLIGALSDRYGRRWLLIGGTALFALASAMGAVAPDNDAFMAVRVLQAIGACAGMALTRAIARDLFSHEQTARALAAISAAVTITPIIAPLIGGYMHVWFGWRSEFLLLAVVGVAITWLVARHVPETNRSRQHGRNLVRGLVAGATVLLRERTFVGYVLIISGASSAFYAFMTAAPVLLIDGLRISPEQFGRDMMLGPAGYIVAAMVSNRSVVRVGTDALLALGALSLFVATGVLAVSAMFASPAALLVPFCLAGFGMGLCLPNGNAGALSVRPQLAGTAAGVSGFLQMLVAASMTAAMASVELTSARPVALVWFLCAAITALGWTLVRGRHGAIVRL